MLKVQLERVIQFYFYKGTRKEFTVSILSFVST